jgi:tol-pal system protein YbgF
VTRRLVQRAGAAFAVLPGLILLLAGLAGEARAQLFTDTESRKAIAAQREVISGLQAQIAELVRQNEQLLARVGQLETAVKSQALLELLNQIEQLQVEVRRLRGQQEVLGNAQETSARRQRDMYVDLDTRLRRLEAPSAAAATTAVPAPGAAAGAPSPAGPGTTPSGPGPSSAAPAAPGTAPAAATPPASPGAGGTRPSTVVAAPAAASAPGGTTAPGLVIPPAAIGKLPPGPVPASGPPGPAVANPPAAAVDAATVAAEQKLYDTAHQARKIGNFAGAINDFQSLVKANPRGRLAPAAQYWIGDSHFNLREYRAAIAAQRQLISTWPDSDKVPDAMLNIASAQAELGETAAARRTMEDLIARHPKSEAADRARQRLAVRK